MSPAARWILALLCCQCLSASALANDIRIGTVPGSVDLPLGASTELHVLIDNPNAVSLEGFRLSCEPEGELEIDVLETPSSTTLVPNGQMYWRIGIRRTGRDAGPILLVLHYSTGGAGAETRRAIHSVSVTPPAKLDYASEIVVDIGSPSWSITQSREGEVLISVGNRSPFPLLIRDIALELPEGLATEYEFEKATPLQQGSVAVYRVRLRAADKVVSGKYTYFVSVTVSPEDDLSQSHSFSASSSISAAADFDLPISSWLGVPSFLLLPGFIVLMAMSMGSSMLGLGNTWCQFNAKSPTFWILSVSISLLAVGWIYPSVTAFFGQPRSLLSGYSYTDVRLVWVGSIALGAIALAFSELTRRLLVWLFRLQIQDEPKDVVRKLACWGILGWDDSVKRTRASFRGTAAAAEEKSGYLARWNPGQAGTVWLIPKIVVGIPGTAGPEVKVSLVEILEKSPTMREVWRFMHRHRRMKLALSWKPGESLTGPVETIRTSLSHIAGEALCVDTG